MYIVYGLTANPPTLDHIAFIQQLIQNTHSTIIIIPNKCSPLKTESLDEITKIAMLNSMLEEAKIPKDRYQLSQVETHRPAPSRMVTTLQLLNLGSSEDVALALGIDNLASLTQWYHWEELKQWCTLRFYPRELSINETMMNHMIDTLYALNQNKMPMTFIYETDQQKKIYDHLIQQIAKKGSIHYNLIHYLREPIQTCAGSSTEIRAYYAKGHTQKHPKLSQRAHELYLEYLNVIGTPKGKGSL